MSVNPSARRKDNLSPRVASNQPKLVVDRETKKNNAISNIAQALADAPPGSKIQIASNIYDEGMVIEVPELTLEPKDLGGEVTIQQHISPCLIIDIGTALVNMLQAVTKVIFEHVPALKGHPWNELADVLCELASSGRGGSSCIEPPCQSDSKITVKGLCEECGPYTIVSKDKRSCIVNGLKEAKESFVLMLETEPQWNKYGEAHTKTKRAKAYWNTQGAITSEITVGSNQVQTPLFTLITDASTNYFYTISQLQESKTWYKIY